MAKYMSDVRHGTMANIQCLQCFASRKEFQSMEGAAGWDMQGTLRAGGK